MRPAPATARKPSAAPDGPAAGGAEGALGLHTGLWNTAPAELPGADGRFRDPRQHGCLRSRVHLVSEHGELVEARCKGPNQCDYCAKLAAIENSEMLILDAMEGNAPQLVAILGTARATTDMSGFYLGHKAVFRRLRREFGRHVEYASLVEFTTGYGPRSGGKRRPHWNLLIKGIPASAKKRARRAIVEAWCANVPGARPGAQYVAPVRDVGGLMRYVAHHFQKESQMPPAGFRGQRFNCSRGYFTGKTRAEAREDAKLSLQEKRLIRRLGMATGLEGDALEDAVDAFYGAVGFPEWRLYGKRPPRQEGDGDGFDAPLHIVVAAQMWKDGHRPLPSVGPGTVEDRPALGGGEGRWEPGHAASTGSPGVRLPLWELL